MAAAARAARWRWMTAPGEAQARTPYTRAGGQRKARAKGSERLGRKGTRDDQYLGHQGDLSRVAVRGDEAAFRGLEAGQAEERHRRRVRAEVLAEVG